MGKLGKFQKELFTKWGGVTKKNHINSVFQEQPQQLTNLVTQLLAFHRGKTLDTFLSKFPVKYFDSDDEYTWPIVGSAVKNLPLVEARDIDGNIIDETWGQTYGNAGKNVEPFYVVFAENLFADGAVIVGELNEIYPHEPFQIGNIIIMPFQVMHGKLPILGFRFTHHTSSIVYITDMKTMDDAELPYIMGEDNSPLTTHHSPDTLIVNALRQGRPHHSHQLLDDAVKFAERVGARQTWLIHPSHEIGLHAEVNAMLPPHIQLAHDGLEINV